MSRKIRLGNDIDITWSLLDKDERPYIVGGRDFAVEIHIGKKRFKISNTEASGNSIHFTYYGKDQKVTGPATLVYIENGGRVDMVTFDTKDVFTMVEHSWLAVDSDEQPETVTLDVVTVLSNLESSIGPRGYSAYEIAVQNGYTGTEEEWLASLKPHITADANGNVYCDGELLTDVIYSVVSAVTVGEHGRQEAETARRTQETARQTAEGRRATAEEGRAAAESGRASAEQSRVAAETTRENRSTSDHQRAENDHSRADQDHQAVAKAVLFTPQTLTEGEKAQARENIGVESTGTDTEAVHFTQQSLTDPQKLQARTNIGATAPEIFLAEYGVTTAAEIEAALNAGKIVAMLYSNKVYFVTANNATNYLVFTSPSDDTIFNIRVNRSDSSYGNPFNLTYEQAGRKKSTITGNESSDAYYPTTKAVADAITAAKQIFVATYGTTTATEIEAAITAGKLPICLYSDNWYVYGGSDTTRHYFTRIYGGVQYAYLGVNKSNSNWASTGYGLQAVQSRVNTLSGYESSTTHFPSTKAVADALPVAMTDAELDDLFDSNWQ